MTTYAGKGKVKKMSDTEKEVKVKIEKHSVDDDIPSPEKIGQLLDVVSERVPKLLRDISDVLYGEGRAKQYAVSVATFYKELKASGMTDKEAFALTKDYMAALSLPKSMGNIRIDDDEDEKCCEDE